MKCKGVCDRCKGLDDQWHMHDYIPDLDTSAGHDQASRDYTSLSVPSQLTVRPSSIPGAGLGVFANTFISSNVRVGKFEGKIVTGELMKDCDTAYAWEVSGNSAKECYLVDGKDPDHSNWLRYVNCARYSEEQNLIAYQYNQNIYYRTIRHIYRNEELLVWYGDDYARELGLSTNSGSERALDCQRCGDFLSKETKEDFLKGDNMSYKFGMEDSPVDCKKPILYPLRVKNGKGDTWLRTSVKNRQQVSCPICCKSVAGASFSRHVKTHSKVRRYGCKVCGKSFKRSDHLLVHMRTVHQSSVSKGKRKKSDGKARGQLKQKAGHSAQKYNIHKREVSKNLGDRKYECDTCEKQFKRRGHLSVHRQAVHGIEKCKKVMDLAYSPYVCDICENRFTRKEYVSNHKQAVHGIEGWKKSVDLVGRPFRCDTCDKSFTRKEGLSFHKRAAHGVENCKTSMDLVVRLYECDVCKEHLKGKEQLSAHKQKVHGAGRYKSNTRGTVTRRTCSAASIISTIRCVYCLKDFSSPETLKVHIYEEHKPFKCELCDERFATNVLLSRHVAAHRFTGPYQCYTCKKTYSRSDSLKRHIENNCHGKTVPFQCKSCGMCFNYQRSLDFHTKRGSCGRSRYYGSYSKATKKVQHNRGAGGKVETVVRERLCRLCKRSFRTKPRLYNHMCKHLSGCVTDKESKQKLMAKMEAMFDEKDYKCHDCTACFSKRISLLVHQRVHTGRLEFRCEYCKAVFHNFKLLCVHIAEHKEEQLVCLFCNVTLKKKMTGLITHMKRLHCKKHFCHLCSKEYDDARRLSNHLRRTHFISKLQKKTNNLTLKDLNIIISPLIIP